MRVDPDLYIVEVGTERAKVSDTYHSSIDVKPPPPQPLRLFNNTIYPFHFVYVRRWLQLTLNNPQIDYMYFSSVWLMTYLVCM